MSRIYKPVSSRGGVFITERNLGNQTHGGGMIKIRSGGQFAPGALKIHTESSLQSVQNQVEQLRLREQEVDKITDGEASQKQNVCQQQMSRAHTMIKPSSEPKVQIQLPQNSTKSINTQSDATVTTPATARFTIRSASRGTGKRGTTFTITPRKSGSPGTPSSSVTTPKASSPSSTAPNTPSDTPELSKKRYPTAEEIQVLGGYQKLERSCLMKNREWEKMARVRFDEAPVLVWTYPSEVSVVCEGESSDDWRRPEKKEEDVDEEAGEDEVTGAGSGLSRVLRVDESCHR